MTRILGIQIIDQYGSRDPQIAERFFLLIDWLALTAVPAGHQRLEADQLNAAAAAGVADKRLRERRCLINLAGEEGRARRLLRWLVRRIMLVAGGHDGHLRSQ